MAISSEITKATDKKRVTWNIIKRETGKSSDNMSEKNINIKLNNNQVESNSNKVANLFNDYFTNIAPSLVSNKNSSLDDSYQLLTANEKSIKNTIFMSPILRKEVQTAIQNIKNKKSAGVDEIPSSLLKRCSNYICHPLAEIFNLSICEGKFPNKMKTSIVIPLHKKGSKQDISNYRPISLLLSLSKIFEKLMAERIVNFANKYNIFSECQHGFRKGKTTDNATMSLITQITTSLDSKNKVLGMFCDLSKAFDCVNHEILLMKLQYYGIRGVTNTWIRSYLENRQQTVQVNNTKSNLNTVLLGVPQGSILGPLLFLFYINDLPKNVLNSKITMFADDTSAIVSAKTERDSESKAHAAMQELEKWFHANKLILNSDKSTSLSFSWIKSHDNQINPPLNRSTHLKFLGTIIDEQLTWNQHIKYLRKKLTTAYFALKKIAVLTNQQTVKIVYHAYFESVMRFGLIFWGNSKYAQKIFTLQKKAVRCITNSKRRHSAKPIFKTLDILPLPSLYIYECLSFVYKNNNSFTQNSDTHSHNTRGSTQISIHRHRTTKYEKQANFMCPTLFNKLSEKSKKIKPLSKFQYLLNSFLREHGLYKIKDFMDLDDNIDIT
jgi:hypothetical protein